MKEKIKTGLSPFLLILLLPMIINPFSGANPSEIPKYGFFLFIVALVTVLAAFAKNSKQNRIFKTNNKVFILGILFIGSAAISTAFSIAPHESFFGNYMSLKGLIEIISWFFFFLLAQSYFQKNQNIGTLFYGIEIVGIICALYGLSQKFTTDFSGILGAGQVFAGRIYSFFSNPNDFGQFLIFPFFATLANIADKQNRRKKIMFLHAFSIIIISISLLLSANRASILAIICGLFIYVLLNIKKLFTKIIACFIFASGSAITILIFFMSTRSINSRIILWWSSLQMIFEKPLFGYGPETFYAAVQPFISPKIYIFEQFLALPNHPHNETLALYLSQGFLGLAIYISILIILIIAALRTIYKKSPNQRIVKYALATLLATVITVQFSYLQITHIAFLLVSAAIIVVNSLPLDLNIDLKIIKIPAIICVTFFTVWFGTKMVITDQLLGTAMGYSITNVSRANEEFSKTLSINNLFTYPFDAAITLLPDPALIDLKRYGAITGYNYQYYSNAGILAYKSKQPEKALNNFNRAYALAPNSARVCSDQMSSAMTAGDFKNAKLAAAKCYNLLPDFIKTNTNPSPGGNEIDIYLKSNPVYFEIMKVLNS